MSVLANIYVYRYYVEIVMQLQSYMYVALHDCINFLAGVAHLLVESPNFTNHKEYH